MQETVIKILKENPWSVATFHEEVNVVPVGFKTVTEDGRLLIGNVMMKTTVENIQATGKAAVSAYDPKTSEGYQIKGKACYVTAGPRVDLMKAVADQLFHGAVAIQGVVVIIPEKVIVTSPGPDNKKELPL